MKSKEVLQQVVNAANDYARQFEKDESVKLGVSKGKHYFEYCSEGFTISTITVQVLKETFLGVTMLEMDYGGGDMLKLTARRFST